ncbi:hypothetical protein SRO_0099 [Streptomyces rochei]|nr:hypothetical protein SRO_0099 [Streptomyces rochei]
MVDVEGEYLCNGGSRLMDEVPQSQLPEWSPQGEGGAGPIRVSGGRPRSRRSTSGGGCQSRARCWRCQSGRWVCGGPALGQPPCRSCSKAGKFAGQCAWLRGGGAVGQSPLQPLWGPRVVEQGKRNDGWVGAPALATGRGPAIDQWPGPSVQRDAVDAAGGAAEIGRSEVAVDGGAVFHRGRTECANAVGLALTHASHPQ